MVMNYTRHLIYLFLLFKCSISLFKKRFLNILVAIVISVHGRNLGGGEEMKIERKTFPMFTAFINHQG